MRVVAMVRSLRRVWMKVGLGREKRGVLVGLVRRARVWPGVVGWVERVMERWPSW